MIGEGSRPHSRLQKHRVKHCYTLLAALLVDAACDLYGVDLLFPGSRGEGRIVYAPYPYFRWNEEADFQTGQVHQIQIARDENFEESVCEECLSLGK